MKLLKELVQLLSKEDLTEQGIDNSMILDVYHDPKPIHVVKASMMPKIELAYLVLGRLFVDTRIDLYVPQKYVKGNVWTVHVYDVRINKVINLIARGLQNGTLTKTI